MQDHYRESFTSPEEIPDSAKIDASLFRENLSKARDLPAEKLFDKEKK